LTARHDHEVPDSDVPKLGAPGNAEGGVVVTAVDPNGVAADHRFQVGEQREVTVCGA
jgi:hypothetical protein